MIDIVIVNWNSGELINSCIKSIHKHQENAINKIIVVDNGYRWIDSSLEDFPLVTLVRAKSNLLCKGMRLGAQYTTNDFILFLNPDTVIYPILLKSFRFYVRTKSTDIWNLWNKIN